MGGVGGGPVTLIRAHYFAAINPSKLKPRKRGKKILKEHIRTYTACVNITCLA